MYLVSIIYDKNSVLAAHETWPELALLAFTMYLLYRYVSIVIMNEVGHRKNYSLKAIKKINRLLTQVDVIRKIVFETSRSESVACLNQGIFNILNLASCLN